MDDFHARLKKQVAFLRRRSLQFYITNLIIDFAKHAARKLGRPDLAESHSTHALAQFAAKLDEQQLKKTEIDPKYLKHLHRLPEVSRIFFNLCAYEIKKLKRNHRASSTLGMFRPISLI